MHIHMDFLMHIIIMSVNVLLILYIYHCFIDQDYEKSDI